MQSSLPLFIVLGALATGTLGFVPSVQIANQSSSSFCKRSSKLLRDRAFTYEDWHSSLHAPLDDLGVDDFSVSVVCNVVTPRSRVGNRRENVVHNTQSTHDGSLPEIARAFLPVVALVSLEIMVDYGMI